MFLPPPPLPSICLLTNTKSKVNAKANTNTKKHFYGDNFLPQISQQDFYLENSKCDSFPKHTFIFHHNLDKFIENGNFKV